MPRSSTTRPGAHPRLNPKQIAFAREYAIDGNGAAAARRAGYSEKCANVIAHKLLNNPGVWAKVLEYRVAADRMVGSRRAEYLGRMDAVYARCMQHEPATDEKGKAIGEFKFEPHAAIRATELQMKADGILREQFDAKLQNAVRSILECARPFMKKPETYADAIEAIAHAMGIAGVDSGAAVGDPERTETQH